MFLFSQGVDLRHYSKQVELELQQIEQKSIRDCILQQRRGVLLLKWAFCGGMVLTAQPVLPSSL